MFPIWEGRELFQEIRLKVLRRGLEVDVPEQPPREEEIRLKVLHLSESPYTHPTSCAAICN